MELNDEFEVPLPVAAAWEVLTDVEKVVPSVPGAELREVEGDELRGVMRVKVGATTVSYRGDAHFESLDKDAHKLVLRAEGREIRGQGTATAVVTATLLASPTGTTVRIVSDLSVTGKLAQFGHDELADAFARLVDEFSRNLEATLPGAPEPAGEAGIDADVASYKAEIEAEVADDLVEAGKEATFDEVGSDVRPPDRGSYDEDDWSAEHPIAKRESLVRRLAPYLTVAGVALILRIVLYSLRRRRR
ncbi:MAG: SRPBCC family protein [Acidimicrobiales bacterium]|jgi:carbon monoxide dehydrogenase subunit G